MVAGSRRGWLGSIDALSFPLPLAVAHPYLFFFDAARRRPASQLFIEVPSAWVRRGRTSRFVAGGDLYWRREFGEAGAAGGVEGVAQGAGVRGARAYGARCVWSEQPGRGGGVAAVHPSGVRVVGHRPRAAHRGG